MSRVDFLLILLLNFLFLSLNLVIYLLNRIQRVQVPIVIPILIVLVGLLGAIASILTCLLNIYVVIVIPSQHPAYVSSNSIYSPWKCPGCPGGVPIFVQLPPRTPSVAVSSSN